MEGNEDQELRLVHLLPTLLGKESEVLRSHHDTHRHRLSPQANLCSIHPERLQPVILAIHRKENSHCVQNGVLLQTPRPCGEALVAQGMRLDHQC